MNHRSSIVSALCLSALCATRAAHADPPAEPTRPVYQFDVSVTGVDDGPHAAPATYTILLQENTPGGVSTGTNIPLSTASAPGAPSPRQDVGLNLRLSYTLRGQAVVVSGSVELSSVDAPSSGAAVTIRRVRADGVAMVSANAPALFARVSDVASHRRYEVTISARRVL